MLLLGLKPTDSSLKSIVPLLRVRLIDAFAVKKEFYPMVSLVQTGGFYL